MANPAAVRKVRDALREMEQVENALADAQARIPTILNRAREARRQIEAVLPAPKDEGSK